MFTDYSIYALYAPYSSTQRLHPLILTSCAKDSSAFSCIDSIEADKAGIAPLIAYTHVNNCQGGAIFHSYTRVIVETNLQQYTVSIKNCSVPTVEDVTWSCCTAGKLVFLPSVTERSEMSLISEVKKIQLIWKLHQNNRLVSCCVRCT